MSDAQIARVLESVFGKMVAIISREPLSGGCIHHAERVRTTFGEFFLKHNTPDQHENFQAEANGLKTLAETHTLRVPKCIAVSNTQPTAFLILEWIESGKKLSDFWEHFANALANLHRHTQPTFGYKRENFIGILPQRNRPHTTWCDFFREERLLPMLKLALRHQRLSLDDIKRVEQLFPKLETLIPDELPALLHGDLWSGNLLVDKHGLPVVIDPDVYYGHREAELAFMHLFGGFDARLFEAYNAVFPLETAWRKRIDLFNLYPLLVHLVLFGRSYWGQIDAALKKFSL